MFHKLQRRNQENLYTGRRPQQASLVVQNSDVQPSKNRVLQDVQQNIQPKSVQNKRQSIQPDPKKSDQEQRPALLEITSPIAALGTSDISYRIVNEILNQNNRSDTKFKANSRIGDRKKSPHLVTQRSIDIINEPLKSAKAVFEENEELIRLERKISQVKENLEKKKENLDENRKKYADEAMAIDQREKDLKDEGNKLRERSATRSKQKNTTKENGNVSSAKEQIRNLKGQLQHLEREMARVDDMLEQQQKEKITIGKSASSGFEDKIKKFEEAIMSVEKQKGEIYNKLNEAVQSYHQDLEQKAMLKEDLSGKLLQRADLVAQREDLEETIENFRENHRAEVEFYEFESQTKKQIMMLETSIQNLRTKENSLKKQDELTKAKHQYEVQKIKNEWKELCEAENRLNSKAKHMKLALLEDVYKEVLRKYRIKIEGRVWEYMQNEAKEEGLDDEIEGIKIKGRIREEVLRIWREQVGDRLEEIIGQEEGKKFVQAYKTFCEDLNSYETQGKASREHAGKVTEEIDKVVSEIQQNETKKKELENELQRRSEFIQNIFIDEAGIAFQAYLQQQTAIFQAIANQYGQQAVEVTKQEQYQEFIQIALKSLMDRIEHFRCLQKEVKALEKTIKGNTDIVDERLLPLLQKLLSSIEEGPVLISTLKHQQILILKTEAEAKEQLIIAQEKKEEAIYRSHQQYEEKASIPSKDLQETRKNLEKSIGAAREEIARLEGVVGIGKTNNEGISEEKQFENINHELREINIVRRPRLNDLKMQLGVWDKEVKELEKLVEQLEMQKFDLEQQVIEQNYLSDKVPYQSYTPTMTLRDRSVKTLNFDTEEVKSSDKHNSSNSEREYKNRSRLAKSLKNPMIQELMDTEIITTRTKIDSSPVRRNAMTPVGQNSNQKVVTFQDPIESIGHLQTEPSTTKSMVSSWNYFCPLAKENMLNVAQKVKDNSKMGKHSYEKPSGIRREEASSLSYQRQLLAQKQPAESDKAKKRKAAVSIDVRTLSLPQNCAVNSKQSAANFLTQTTSPVNHVAFGKPPIPQQPKDYQKEEDLVVDKGNLQALYTNYVETKGLTKENEREGNKNVNGLPPKPFNMLMETLKPHSVSYKSVQSHEVVNSMSEIQQRFQEFIRQNGKLPSQDNDSRRIEEQNQEILTSRIDDYQEGSGVEKPKIVKPLQIDTSLNSNNYDEEGSTSRRGAETAVSRGVDENFSFCRNNPKTERSDLNKKKTPHNLHDLMEMVRKGRQESVRDGTRSKSTDTNKEKKEAKATGNLPYKITHRDRTDRSHGNLEMLTGRIEVESNRGLGTPSMKVNQPHENKARTPIDEHALQEGFLLELMRSLTQDSLLYKKLTNYQATKQPAFNPLTGDVNPPEVCGYGLRCISLNTNLDRIEVKHIYKPSVEVSILMDNVSGLTIPRVTIDLLRIQKKIPDSHPLIKLCEDPSNLESIGDITKRGGHGLNGGTERYLNCSYYSFTILTENSGKVEFVAPNYDVFKEWVNGINMFLKYKAQIPKLKMKF